MKVELTTANGPLVIAYLLGGECGGSLRGPNESIEGPYEVTSRFGMEPTTTQTQLPG